MEDLFSALFNVEQQQAGRVLPDPEQAGRVLPDPEGGRPGGAWQPPRPLETEAGAGPGTDAAPGPGAACPAWSRGRDSPLLDNERVHRLADMSDDDTDDLLAGLSLHGSTSGRPASSRSSADPAATASDAGVDPGQVPAPRSPRPSCDAAAELGQAGGAAAALSSMLGVRMFCNPLATLDVEQVEPRASGVHASAHSGAGKGGWEARRCLLVRV